MSSHLELECDELGRAETHRVLEAPVGPPAIASTRIASSETAEAPGVAILQMLGDVGEQISGDTDVAG